MNINNYNYFQGKLDALNNGLDNNQWVDDTLSVRTKDCRFVRILKTIAGFIFQKDFFCHIKVNKVASGIFNYCSQNKEFLDAANQEKVFNILNKLELKTAKSKDFNKYHEKIELIKTEIKGFASSKEKSTPESLHKEALVKMEAEDWKNADVLLTKAKEASLLPAKPSLELLKDLAFTKNKLKDWKSADAIYEQIIPEYGDKVPTAVLVYAAKMKGKLNKPVDAEQMIDKALACPDVKADGYYIAAVIKLQNKKVPEGEDLFNKAIVAAGDKAPLHYFLDCASLKFKLGKFDEAESLYDKVIAMLENKLPLQILLQIAAVKYKVKKYEESDNLYATAIKTLGPKIPKPCLFDAAYIKTKLLKWKQAEELYTLALKDKPKVSIGILVNFANVKSELKKWEDAETIYDQLLALGNEIPPTILVKAAIVKAALSKYEKAEPLFDKAIQLLGDKVTPEILIDAGTCKQKLNKEVEGNELIKKGTSLKPLL